MAKPARQPLGPSPLCKYRPRQAAHTRLGHHGIAPSIDLCEYGIPTGRTQRPDLSRIPCADRALLLISACAIALGIVKGRVALTTCPKPAHRPFPNLP